MGQDIREKMVALVGEDNVRINEPMKKHTTFRIGGVADYFVTPCSILEVREVVALCKEEHIPFYLIGNGSNLLVSDEGYRGVIIQLYDKFNAVEWREESFVAQAGCLLSSLGNEAARRGLTGFEFATGIPGTIGGAVVMNAGAYGGEMKDCLVRVHMMDQEGIDRWYEKEELELGYRTSIASTKELVVLEAEVALAKGDVEVIKSKLSELSLARRTKQPLEYPSAGSTFKRPEGYFAGKLIQDAGYKGYVHGGAMVSDKHSGFVINKDGATAKDVLELVQIVQEGVFRQFGVHLEMEVKKLGDF